MVGTQHWSPVTLPDHTFSPVRNPRCLDLPFFYGVTEREGRNNMVRNRPESSFDCHASDPLHPMSQVGGYHVSLLSTPSRLVYSSYFGHKDLGGYLRPYIILCSLQTASLFTWVNALLIILPSTIVNCKVDNPLFVLCHETEVEKDLSPKGTHPRRREWPRSPCLRLPEIPSEPIPLNCGRRVQVRSALPLRPDSDLFTDLCSILLDFSLLYFLISYLLCQHFVPFFQIRGRKYWFKTSCRSPFFK